MHPLWFRVGVLVMPVLASVALAAQAPAGYLAVPVVLVLGWRLAAARVLATSTELRVHNFARNYRIPSEQIEGWVTIGGQIGVRTTTGQMILMDAVRSASLRGQVREARVQDMLAQLVGTQNGDFRS